MPKANLVKLFGQVCVIAAILLGILFYAVTQGFSWAYYILYAWKDLYIVALVEVFYTYTNTVLSIEKASWIYGFFGAVGSVGGILGNLLVGEFAKKIGSEKTLFYVLPLLLFMALLGYAISWLHGPVARPQENKTDSEPKAIEPSGMAAGKSIFNRGWTWLKETTFIKACKIVVKSEYLLHLAGMIILVQTAMTLIDYEYSHAMIKAFADADERTAVIGRIYALVSIVTLVLKSFIFIIFLHI